MNGWANAPAREREMGSETTDDQVKKDERKNEY